MSVNNIAPSSKSTLILSGLFLACYAIGILFPDAWWGAHYLAFLPAPLNYILLILALLLVVYTAKKAPRWELPNVLKNSKRSTGTISILAIGLVMAAIFYNFPIANDNYGDAFQYAEFLQKTATELPPNFHDDIFSLDLMPSSGRKTVLLYYTYLSHITNAPYETIFRWSGALFGFGFVIIWLFFVRTFLKRIEWQLLLGLAGILAPFMQLYYGHIETYAPVFMIFLAWLVLLLLQLKKRSTILLWILLPLLIISIRMHPLTLLLGLAWTLAFLHHYFGAKPLIQRLFTWKGIAIAVLTPIMLLGAFVYFAVFEDHIDPRNLDGVPAIERLFLPIFSPEAPLDRYNIFSFNHLFDFFQMMLLWSPPVLFLLLFLRTSFRKKINWKEPSALILGTTLILFCTLLFAINPLLSMPMDWDLFSFPAPILLLLAVVLISQVESEKLLPKVAPSMLALILLSIPVFVVNASQTMHSYRIESVGIHQYKTYYLHSNRNLITALSMIPDNLELYLERKQKLIDKLEPHAIPGNDQMYSSLFYDDAVIHMNVTLDYEAALDRLQSAIQYNSKEKQIIELLKVAKLKVIELNLKRGDFAAAYDLAVTLVPMKYPSEKDALGNVIHCALEAKMYQKALRHCNEYLAIDPTNIDIKESQKYATLKMMETNFIKGDFLSAYKHAKTLIALAHPSEKQAIRIAVHCALEAKLYDDALQHSTAYLQLDPSDEMIQEVALRLQNNDRVDEVKLLFSQGQ